MSALAALRRAPARLLGRLVRPDVYVVFLEHGPAHRASGRAELRAFLDRLFPGQRVREVVVDNAFARDADVPPADGADTIAGDNSSREFSGFDAGIAHLVRKHRPPPRAVFVLANDTFHRSYGTSYLERFRGRAVRAALRRGEAVGHVDGYPSEVTVLGLPVQRWIRTSLVLLDRRTLDALGPLAIPVPDDRIFGGADAFFRDDAPLSENYKAFLRAWLFGEDCAGWDVDTYGRWHSMNRLTPENLADFRGKARSILCEHYLSARLRRLGVGLCKVN